MAMIEPLENKAVEIRGLNKYYGLRKSKVTVLNQVNLSVPKGCIFGLLGPSGCGKTTLLNCVVGRIRADKGTVLVFGERAGSPNCKIPGPGVGYMPQELALFDELTAKETLQYFGRIYNMNKVKITERLNFLFDFLNIPTEGRLIKNLSGGQQRRVSFAIALIHEPPLLILDEPTVGVDPILRINIWKHLGEMSFSGNVTTIITTHYIEEAMKASEIGLMREGRILTADEPQLLLNRYNLPTLEDVFLHLCHNNPSNEKTTAFYDQTTEVNENGLNCESRIFKQKLSEPIEIPCRQPKRKDNLKFQCSFKSSWNKTLAVGIKNFNSSLRKWPQLIFQFLTPSILIILTCLAISGTPHNLNIAVANEDTFLGERFLTYIDNTTVHQIPVPDIKTAESMVLRGKAWGLIHIQQNFTTSLAKRFLKFGNVTADVIAASNIHVRLDTSNLLISYAVQFTLVDALINLATALDGKFGFDLNTVSIPIKFGEPIFGADNHNLSEYVIPGCVVVIAFFVAFGLTSLEFAVEKKRGLLDRSYVAGVTPVNLLCGHLMIQIIMVICQNGLLLFFLIIVFKFPCHGILIWAILLPLLQGLCGISCGYFLSALLQDEFTLITIGTGCLFCSMILGGLVWPLEAMPDYLAKFGRLMPQSYASESLRSILSRGWDVSHEFVWRGYLSTAIWVIIYLALALIAIRVRR